VCWRLAVATLAMKPRLGDTDLATLWVGTKIFRTTLWVGTKMFRTTLNEHFFLTLKGGRRVREVIQSTLAAEIMDVQMLAYVMKGIFPLRLS